MTNKESQNKQKKKKEALSKVIGFRIDNNLKEELEPLLINEESFNLFARRMIDVDRIVSPIDVSRELMAVSILEVEKSHFDSFSKIFWGMINNEDSVKAKVDFQLTNYLICLRKICHLLTVHNSNFPKSESSTRYIGNEGNDFEYQRQNFYSLVEKGQDAIEGILDLARESEHPRTYEVAGQLIKNVAEVTEKLGDLHLKMQKLKELPDKGPKNVTNALFVGSTTELQKMLKNNK